MSKIHMGSSQPDLTVKTLALCTGAGSGLGQKSKFKFESLSRSVFLLADSLSMVLIEAPGSHYSRPAGSGPVSQGVAHPWGVD